MTDAEKDRKAIEWQTSVWNRISDVYTREIDERFVPVVDAVIARAGLNPGEKVLDLGMGTGAITERASEAVGPDGRVVGVDISPEMIAAARKRLSARGVTNVVLKEGRAESLPVEDDGFDVALSSLSLMYVVDRGAAAWEIARALRPGGR